MTTELLNREVINESGVKLGRVTDVLFAGDDESPRWAVVSAGLLASARYVPLGNAYTSNDGRVVVPYDKATVKHAPKADRDHVLTPAIEEHLARYYDIN
jgi:sporulation protein YlmC with PRC-barrel domain